MNQADITPVDLRLSVVKPLSAQWMIKLYDHLKKRPDIIVHGFKGTGMFDCMHIWLNHDVIYLPLHTL